jgi:F-type H+-transporting ATPase subunit delta
VRDFVVVKRYADAYVAYARARVPVEKVCEEVKRLRAIIHGNPGFMEVLTQPQITLTEKNEFIEKVLNDDFSDEIRHFLFLLVERGRIDKLHDIAEYIRVIYSHGEEVEALIKTSYSLDIDEIEAIKAKLEQKFNKKFKCYIELDGSLLGGVQVTIGNTVIDGSVRHRLEELREKLQAVRV